MTDDTLAAGVSADETTTAAAPEAGGVSVSGAETTTTQDSTQSQTSGTLAGGNATDKPVSSPANWPEDWRVKLAGEDKSYLKTLDRFNSPADLAKAYRDAQARLSSGQLKAALPENPTAEELANWRTQNGVPESADKYDVNLGDGFVWGDADKPLLDDFTKYAHESNMPADQVKKVLGWYASLQERQSAAREEADERFHQEAEDTLRSEWGQEYRRNLNAIGNVFDAHSNPEVKDAIFMARLPNGRLLGDDPDAVKVLAAIARTANPSATVVPSNGFGTMDDELTALSKKVGTTEYWRDPKMQERYAELLQAKEAYDKRNGRAA